MERLTKLQRYVLNRYNMQIRRFQDGYPVHSYILRKERDGILSEKQKRYLYKMRNYQLDLSWSTFF